ncbi:MAG: nitroreductase [Chloroflexi bacterium]|nr:nitroreductase [Chloroflexota bacterium]
MNTIDALTSRYCCRAFKPDPVSKETVLRILEAATRAPSWANTQPWEIHVATGEVLERLRQAYLKNLQEEVAGHPDLPRPQSWPLALQKRTEDLMAKRSQLLGVARDDSTRRKTMMQANYKFFGAPVVIYLCMDRTLSPWSVFDLGSLSQSIMLAATDNGLDTAVAVMLAAYPDLIRAHLEIPDDLSIIIGIALGFNAPNNPENRFRSPRRSLSDVVHLKGF